MIMEDLKQLIVLLAIAGFTGWITVNAIRKGSFDWKAHEWSRSEHPIIYYLMTLITGGICLLELRIIVYGLFES